MKLPRSYDVVDIAPATGQEARVFPAAKWYADAIFGSVSSLSGVIHTI